MITLSNHQARQFLLLKHGLLGEHRFTGKQGVLDFVRQAGCIQFDPVDVCGKNAELVCQSRVKGFTKDLLWQLLYEDRVLLDYVDKQISIIRTEDWPYFSRFKNHALSSETRYPQMKAAKDRVRAHLETGGAVCSDDLELEGDFYWHSSIHWSGGSNLSRSVLEQMFTTGELIIHHKEGSRKHYGLAERYIPPDIVAAPEPLPDDSDYLDWRVLRRIGAVGLLWNRASDAWGGIRSSAPLRAEIFRRLMDKDQIIEVAVTGLKDRLYCRREDAPLLETVQMNPEPKARCELLAPLDNLLWDRKLIKALFGFEYTWEIYTPAAKLKYGHYVLPLLLGDRFIGRCELIPERKTSVLTVKNIWLEDGVRRTKKLQAAVNKCFERFAKFNGCETVVMQ